MKSSMAGRLLERMRDQRGIAMITVLLAGASLTAVTSTAAFMTIQEFRSTTDDRRGASALSVAEAGVDRMIAHLGSGRVTWGHVRLAGCDNELSLQGEVGQRGDFTARVLVYNPQGASSTEKLPPNACVGRSSDPRDEEHFVIESTGTISNENAAGDKIPTATRVVRQEIVVDVVDLPIGVYSQKMIGSGTANAFSISMFVEGDVPSGRKKFNFSGIDPYYRISDFWPGQSDAKIPAAVHATGSIRVDPPGPVTIEHTPATPLNCTANGLPNGQSQFDQSGGGGPISALLPCAGQTLSPPPTSLFTVEDLNRVMPNRSLTEQEYLALKEGAKATGFYCFVSSTATSTAPCTRNGAPYTLTKDAGLWTIPNNHVLAGTYVPRVFVTYIEFENPNLAFLDTQKFMWKGNVWPCNDDPDQNFGIILIVRNGSLGLETGNFNNGAAFVPEGKVVARGGMTWNGTIITKEFDNSGTSNLQMNECWVNNMPGPFLDITPGQWFEVDR